nr:F-box domain, leucine-rich repeat domain, L domain-like protein [Tanacetum cinerariifolium]
MVEDDPDIIHFDNSSGLSLSTSLNDLDNATLHIDGQSTEVDVPPDIIDVVDEDDDITDDENALPRDLADFDNEDLINVDDDGVDKMSADVARSHGGDGGGKGKRKPNFGGRAAGRLNTRDKTWNLSLKEIMDTKGPVPIQFELRDKQTVMPIGDHATHWSSYTGEVIRDVPLYYPFWLKSRRSGRPRSLQILGNIARAAQNRQNRAKSTVISRHGSRSLARLRDEMRQTSTTQEYPSLIDTFFVAHTVNGEFLRDEDRRIYEMRRLEATGTYTDDEINRLARGVKQRGHIPSVGKVLPARATASPSTPAHESTLNSLHKKVDFMMSLFKIYSKYSDMFSQFESGGASGSGGCGDDEEGADHQDDDDEDGDGDT